MFIRFEKTRKHINRIEMCVYPLIGTCYGNTAMDKKGHIARDTKCFFSSRKKWYLLITSVSYFSFRVRTNRTTNSCIGVDTNNIVKGLLTTRKHCTINSILLVFPNLLPQLFVDVTKPGSKGGIDEGIDLCRYCP